MAKRSTVAPPPRETLNEYVDRAFHEYDLEIQRLRDRCLNLERDMSALLRVLSVKARKK